MPCDQFRDVYLFSSLYHNKEKEKLMNWSQDCGKKIDQAIFYELIQYLFYYIEDKGLGRIGYTSLLMLQVGHQRDP